MTAMIDGVQMKVTSEERTEEATRKETALLRTIETKLSGFEDGSIWLFEHKGLPVAMVELWTSRKNPSWGHTLLAVTSDELTGTVGGNVWSPEAGNGVVFKPIPEADAPRSTPRLRKIQMRQYSRRFKVQEFRLLTEPIHRYAGGDVEDGGIFAFVKGEANPEALVFLQSRGGKWEYGFLRCSSEGLTGTLDEDEVWRVKAAQGYVGSADQPFWVIRRPFQTVQTNGN